MPEVKTPDIKSIIPNKSPPPNVGKPIPPVVPQPATVYPQPPPQPDQRLLTFCEAVKATLNGSKISRLAWQDTRYFGFLDDLMLKLRKPDGTVHGWYITDGDIIADDWIIVG